MGFMDSLQGIGKFGVGPFGLPDLASVGGAGKMLGAGGGIGGLMGPGGSAGMGGSPGENAAMSGGKLALQLAMMAALGG